MERKIEIVSMEFIRPLSPTPNHLRCFEFSYLDQMAPPTSVPLALFYPPPLYGGDEARAANSSRLLLLKKSLSEILARFYPFAGRIKNSSIECNDDGVPFYEAFAHNYQLEDVLKQPDVDVHFLPTVEDNSLLSYSTVPLLVQVTIFECGSMAISTRVSHKIADRASSCALIDAWAITTRVGTKCAVPEFVAAAKFLPPPNPRVLPTLLESQKISSCDNNQHISKIFVFDASTIVSLKAKAISDVVPVPTRVEVVSAVIWKCVMAATSSGPTGRRSSYLIQNVNMRKRFVPPMPKHCVGNVVAVSVARKGENDCCDLPTLVSCIRKGLLELSFKYKNKQERDEAIFAIPYDSMELTRAFRRREVDIYLNSWCGYQFYDIDFGWGKSSWVSPIERHKNVIFLMDSKDGGGIDAWVCLKDKEMEVFEHELKLLAFGFDKN
ncbi:akuammiline synthase 1-like [Nicotiana tabacum]|uniref:Akuammiline synthase 1-like n=2 Tax=Nicotiana TaxID=4085 RepID=A0A1S4DDX9_TOBAC